MAQAISSTREAKPKKSNKIKANPAAGETKKTAQKTKSAEIIPDDEDDDDDDPFAELEVEEGDLEDLRRRELLDDDPPASVAEDHEDADEDDIMGD